MLRPASALFGRHRHLRWLVPAAVAGAVVAVASGAFSAQASTDLPDRSAAQLLADIEASHVDGLSGTVVQKAALGLPELPSTVGAGAEGAATSTGLSLLSLLSGSHTARVWYAGEDKQRVALLDSIGETDFFRNGTDMWTWNSSTKEASHTTVPASAREQTPSTLTPDELATQALQSLSPTTLVTTDSARQVAGRSAYELVLTPRDATSRIASVRIAIDSSTKVPLAVQVYGQNDTKAAIDVSFTDINFNVPDDANFDWTPPKGSTVTQSGSTQAGKDKALQVASGQAEPTTIGAGWTTVLATHAALPAKGNGAGLLSNLTTVSGTWGTGRLLDSKLVTVLFTDDGRMLAGPVEPSVLYAAAATYH